MIYKLFILSFVFFSINDNHCVQAQEVGLRYCRTTGCISRTFGQVIDQCKRLYGSNVFKRESCDGGGTRYRCCTAQTRCRNYPCTIKALGEIEEICASDWAKEGLSVPNPIVSRKTCDGGGTRYQCCANRFFRIHT